MKVVNERNNDILSNIIKTFIKPGTAVMSDCWFSYNCLKDERYLHLR